MHSVAEYDFLQLINIAQVKQLLENHHIISGMAYGIFDTDENNLIAVGWQDICTRFHRVHPDCIQRCRESDAYIKAHLHDNDGGFLEYRCQNGMLDIAMPIIIDGEHMATFFTGQFFYDDDGPDDKYFRAQAEQCGFDRESYLSALQRVPVFSRNHVLGNVHFLCEMVKMLAESGLKNLRLADEIAERSRVEKRLAVLDFAMDHVGEAAYMIDEHARFRYVNREACRTLGYTREELLGMTVADIDLDMSPQLWSESWQHFQPNTSVTIERRHRNSVGSLFPVEITSTYFDYEGKALCLALARNIEERKLFETELNKSRNFLFNVINAIADPVFVKDANHRIVLANNAECILAGCALEQRLGSSDYDFFPKEQSEAFWKNDELVLTSGEPRDYEECITDAEGRVRTFVTHKSRYSNGLGNNFVVGVARDITERKRMEEVLAAREREFHTLAENLPDALIRFDDRYRILYMNPMMRRLLALNDTAKEPEGGNSVAQKRTARFINGLKRAVRIGSPGEVEIPAALPGETRILNFRFVTETDKAGKISSALAIGRDVTELKRANEKVRLSEERLRLTLEATRIGTWDWDIANDRWIASPTYYSMLGYEPKSGQEDRSEWMARAHPEDRMLIQEKTDNALTRDFADFRYEARMRHADGTYRWQNVLGIGIERDADGKVIRMLGIRQDIDDRKRAEEKLRAQEREFRTLAENSPDIIIRYDRTCRRVYCNPAAQRLFGLPPEQVLGTTPQEICIIPEASAYEQRIKGIFSTGREFQMEIAPRTATGECRWLHLRVIPETDPRGEVVCALAVGRDISDQKAAQLDLRESEQRFRDIFDNSLDCLYLLEVTEDGRFRNLEINPAFEQSTGLSRAELIGKYIGENVSAQTADKVLAKYRRCLAAGTPTEEEVELDLPSGKHWYHSSLIPVRDGRGRIHRLVGISRDVTGRKRMEEQLRASERQIRTLADNSPGVIYSYLLRPDKTSCLPYVSSRIAELNGLSPSALTSDASELLATIHPDDLAGVHASIDESARTLYPWHKEFRFRHPTRGDIWVEGRSTPERRADGGILWSGFLCDITEQKKMEEELFAAKKMEIIGQLAGGVAHEVRNPLNAILSISEALFKEREIADNPEYKPFLEHIRNQVNRLSKLMNDLLNLGKPSKPADLIPVALDRLCADTIGLWNLTEISRLHPVVMQGEQIPSPVVLADSTRLSQSLLNLIENAARCSPTDSPITLRIGTVTGQRISLQVQDSGLGVAEDKLDRVFEPFFTMRRKGTGLGLTLVKHFIENMGGAVHLNNNQPPPGCTAEILLNIAKEKELDHEKENTLY